MQNENIVLLNSANEPDEELNINVLKIWNILWSRKLLIIKVFCSVLLFFVLLTFIMPKKYIVTADLYINKSNNSNMMDVNPFVLDDATGPIVSMGSDKSINNEIELIKSELVLDKVIRDNNIRYTKGKRKGEYISAEAFYGKGKTLQIDNVKNTNVISIKFKSRKPDYAYGVVSSLITNYIQLHKEINSEKSKSDKRLLESEYAKIKTNLDKRINETNGLPAQTITGIGNLSAMSAFSRSASEAISNIKSQYMAGEKSQIEVKEESEKLANIAAKLEWAKMVEQMSDSSKVLILKEPKQLMPFEKSSPKLLINIILGCIFGALASLTALIYIECNDKKLPYSVLSDNIIYDGFNDFDKIKIEILGNRPKKVLLVSLVQLSQNIIDKIRSISNADIVYADLTDEFIDKISENSHIIMVSKIQDTNTDTYKKVKNLIIKQNKNITCDILV